MYKGDNGVEIKEGGLIPSRIFFIVKKIILKYPVVFLFRQIVSKIPLHSHISFAIWEPPTKTRPKDSLSKGRKKIKPISPNFGFSFFPYSYNSLEYSTLRHLHQICYKKNRLQICNRYQKNQYNGLSQLFTNLYLNLTILLQIRYT